MDKLIENQDFAPNNGEVILYNPDDTIRLGVRMNDETVWLTQAQMAELFDKSVSVISRHIKNIFAEEELDEKSNLHFLQIANSDKPVKYFSLDVIISVGYRVKSKKGTQFRQWANKVLKEYLLKGYSVNQRIERLEQRMSQTESKIAFFVKTSLPPVEGMFFDGQIFDAYEKMCQLIKSANRRIVLIDNYVDETTLKILSKRADGVTATIYTYSIGEQLQLDIDRHNSQYPPIAVKRLKKSHDRFLILDDDLYSVGASLKDMGKRWFAILKMQETKVEEILERI
ncbi:MAG: virulence RhuM family protein [Bacteroidales bacterium]|nr:virulence RhuM family protein [Bacteroidales bacterium]